MTVILLRGRIPCLRRQHLFISSTVYPSVVAFERPTLTRMRLAHPHRTSSECWRTWPTYLSIFRGPITHRFGSAEFPAPAWLTVITPAVNVNAGEKLLSLVLSAMPRGANSKPASTAHVCHHAKQRLLGLAAKGCKISSPPVPGVYRQRCAVAEIVGCRAGDLPEERRRHRAAHCAGLAAVAQTSPACTQARRPPRAELAEGPEERRRTAGDLPVKARERRAVHAPHEARQPQPVLPEHPRRCRRGPRAPVRMSQRGAAATYR